VAPLARAPRALSVLLFVGLFSGNLAAQQTTIPNYESARDNFFWPELYVDGGESVYCAIPFEAGERLTVEHAYPADWIAEANGCRNRDCGALAYKFASADLHNLWPADRGINSSRSYLTFVISHPTADAS